MKTKVVETSIISETVSQNTISGEVEEPIKDQIPETAKKVPREQTNNQGDQENNEEADTEIKQTGKDMNRAWETYFNFLQTWEK